MIKKSRYLTLFLAIIMIAGNIPLSVFAQEGNTITRSVSVFYIGESEQNPLDQGDWISKPIGDVELSPEKTTLVTKAKLEEIKTELELENYQVIPDRSFLNLNYVVSNGDVVLADEEIERVLSGPDRPFSVYIVGSKVDEEPDEPPSQPRTKTVNIEAVFKDGDVSSPNIFYEIIVEDKTVSEEDKILLTGDEFPIIRDIYGRKLKFADSNGFYAGYVHEDTNGNLVFSDEEFEKFINYDNDVYDINVVPDPESENEIYMKRADLVWAYKDPTGNIVRKDYALNVANNFMVGIRESDGYLSYSHISKHLKADPYPYDFKYIGTNLNSTDITEVEGEDALKLGSNAHSEVKSNDTGNLEIYIQNEQFKYVTLKNGTEEYLVEVNPFGFISFMPPELIGESWNEIIAIPRTGELPGTDYKIAPDKLEGVLNDTITEIELTKNTNPGPGGGGETPPILATTVKVGVEAYKLNRYGTYQKLNDPELFNYEPLQTFVSAENRIVLPKDTYNNLKDKYYRKFVLLDDPEKNGGYHLSVDPEGNVIIDENGFSDLISTANPELTIAVRMEEESETQFNRHYADFFKGKVDYNGKFKLDGRVKEDIPVVVYEDEDPRVDLRGALDFNPEILENYNLAGLYTRDSGGKWWFDEVDERIIHVDEKALEFIKNNGKRYSVTVCLTPKENITLIAEIYEIPTGGTLEDRVATGEKIYFSIDQEGRTVSDGKVFQDREFLELEQYDFEEYDPKFKLKEDILQEILDSGKRTITLTEKRDPLSDKDIDVVFFYLEQDEYGNQVQVPIKEFQTKFNKEFDGRFYEYVSDISEQINELNSDLYSDPGITNLEGSSLYNGKIKSGYNSAQDKFNNDGFKIYVKFKKKAENNAFLKVYRLYNTQTSGGTFVVSIPVDIDTETHKVTGIKFYDPEDLIGLEKIEGTEDYKLNDDLAAEFDGGQEFLRVNVLPSAPIIEPEDPEEIEVPVYFEYETDSEKERVNSGVNAIFNKKYRTLDITDGIEALEEHDYYVDIKEHFRSYPSGKITLDDSSGETKYILGIENDSFKEWLVNENADHVVIYPNKFLHKGILEFRIYDNKDYEGEYTTRTGSYIVNENKHLKALDGIDEGLSTDNTKTYAVKGENEELVGSGLFNYYSAGLSEEALNKIENSDKLFVNVVRNKSGRRDFTLKTYIEKEVNGEKVLEPYYTFISNLSQGFEQESSECYIDRDHDTITVRSLLKDLEGYEFVRLEPFQEYQLENDKWSFKIDLDAAMDYPERAEIKQIFKEADPSNPDEPVVEHPDPEMEVEEIIYAGEETLTVKLNEGVKKFVFTLKNHMQSDIKHIMRFDKNAEGNMVLTSIKDVAGNDKKDFEGLSLDDIEYTFKDGVLKFKYPRPLKGGEVLKFTATGFDTITNEVVKNRTLSHRTYNGDEYIGIYSLPEYYGSEITIKRTYNGETEEFNYYTVQGDRLTLRISDMGEDNEFGEIAVEENEETGDILYKYPLTTPAGEGEVIEVSVGSIRYKSIVLPKNIPDEPVTPDDPDDPEDDDPDDPTEEFTVRLNPSGGKVHQGFIKTVDGKISKLPVPVKSGYDFIGWFDRSGNRYDGGAQISEDMTLYANWKAKATPKPRPSSSKRKKKHRTKVETAPVVVKQIPLKASVPEKKVLPFTDVPADAFFRDAVEWAVEKGITTGTTETAFSPYAPTTRGQMITFLWRAAGKPEPTITELPFIDVDPEAYYYKPILWAYEQGIAKGYSNTEFAPDEEVTRGQGVTFLQRVSGETGEKENPFTDVKPGAYYEGAVSWANDRGITKGTSETTFSPDKSVTRGEMVTFIYRYYTK